MSNQTDIRHDGNLDSSVQVEDYVVGVTTTPGHRSVEQNSDSRLPARQPPPDSLI